MAASWLRCSTRIMRCCLGIEKSLVPGPDHEDALIAVLVAEVVGPWGGRAVHVDVALIDRAAGVLGHEPSAVAVVAVGGDVHPATERNDVGIDRDRLVVPERQRRAGAEADPRKGDITPAGAVVPTASLQREGHAAGSVAPVGAGPPERRAGRELVTGGGGAAALGYPAAAALVLEVIPAAIQGDPVAFHRHAHGRVQPVDAMLAAEAR